MATMVKSFAIQGIDGFVVDIEVKTLDGQPMISVIGLPDQGEKRRRRGSNRRWMKVVMSSQRKRSLSAWRLEIRRNEALILILQWRLGFYRKQKQLRQRTWISLHESVN